MTESNKGARRIVHISLDVMETLSDEPTQLSQIRENLTVEASSRTIYRVLDALQSRDKIQKVNADGEVDENGQSWALADN